MTTLLITNSNAAAITVDGSCQTRASITKLPIDILSYTFKLMGESFRRAINSTAGFNKKGFDLITDTDLSFIGTHMQMGKVIVRALVSFASTCKPFHAHATSDPSAINLIKCYKALFLKPANEAQVEEVAQTRGKKKHHLPCVIQ